jgi:Ser/Thr protein kinase RdoA (MazF antagonist)
VKAFAPELAARALARWHGGEAASLERIATAGNDVWRFLSDGQPFILRLTHVQWRTPSENDAECAFLEHVHARGALVSRPLPSLSGKWVETLDAASASVFTWASGDDAPARTEPFLREWGRSLAVLHEASSSYEGPARWDWPEERLFAEADRILPAADSDIRAQRDELYAELAALPLTRETYGHIHADFGPQNFRVGPDRRITAFDFGNLCRHWFACDVIIALSTLRREPQRDTLRRWLLAGYESVRPLDAEAWAMKDTLLRLRILYVYLSRLEWFGPDPSPERRATIAQLRALVLERVSWP